MRTPDFSPISRHLTIFIGLSVVAAMAFGLSISFYRNILFEETLRDLSAKNLTLRKEIDDDLRGLAYYRSRQLRDKYAKENLGKINPGEKVLLLVEEPTKDVLPRDDMLSRKEEKTAAFHQYLEKIPVLEHWRLYLFDPAGVQKLKDSF